MINLRNQGDYQVVLQIHGTLTASPGLTQATIVEPIATFSTLASYGYSEPIPFNAAVKSVWAYERIPGTGTTSTSGGGDGVDLFYFPPVVTTGSGLPGSGGLTSTLTGISFCQPFPPVATGTVLFNMATSTLNNSGYNQVPVVTWNAASATTAALGGYGAIFSTTPASAQLAAGWPIQQNPPLVQRGGILLAVCRTVGAVAGQDFEVVVELVRQRQGGQIDPTQIGTYGADNDIF